jgi:hypothetical protein
MVRYVTNTTTCVCRQQVVQSSLVVQPVDGYDAVVAEIVKHTADLQHGKLPWFDHACDTECCNGLQATHTVGIADGRNLGQAAAERALMLSSLMATKPFARSAAKKQVAASCLPRQR